MRSKNHIGYSLKTLLPHSPMGRKRRKKKRTQNTQKHPDFQLRKQEEELIEDAKNRLRHDNAKLVGYVITNEPIEDEWSRRLPAKAKECIEDLHGMIASRPQNAITELLKLIERYPNAPILYNYLSAAYERCGDIAQKDAAIVTCYEKFPTYLFGQINYAQQCLEKGEVEKIPEMFGEKLDLKLLYPQRTTFHVSEYTAFTGLVGLYYVYIGKQEHAKQLYKALRRIAPRHHATKRLRRVLYPSLLVRFILWIHKKATGRELSLVKRPTEPNAVQ